MKKWATLSISSLALILSVSLGVFGYKVYSNQKKLEKRLSSFDFVTQVEDDGLSKTEEREVQKVVQRITDPWSDLQIKLKDSVVQIYSLVTEFNWLEPYKTPNQGRGAGTGFFIDDKGHIVTNAHVVNQARAVYIQIPSTGKEQFECEIKCFNPDRDMALIKVKDSDFQKIKSSLGKINYLKLGNSDSVKRGAEIMTLGFPLGQQGLKSTTGVVSGRESLSGRQYIQIDAPINPGNSGGPSLNWKGEVIGVNTADINEAQNVGYIIPVNELKLVLPEMFDSKEKLMRKPFLGVFYNSTSPAMSDYLGINQTGGVYVTDIFQGSLLDKVGVNPGDLIYSINGHKVDMYGDISIPGWEDKISLSDYVGFLPLNKKVNLVLYRGKVKKEFIVDFKNNELPPIRIKYPDYEKIDYEVFGGMVVMSFCRNLLPLLLSSSPDLIKYENPKNQIEEVLVITNVFANSPVYKTRVIKAGNVLKEVNGHEVKNLKDFRSALSNSLDSGYLTIKTENDVFAVVELKDILSDESKLSQIYRYPISDFVQKFIKEYIKRNEKKTGPSIAGAAA